MANGSKGQCRMVEYALAWGEDRRRGDSNSRRTGYKAPTLSITQSAYSLNFWGTKPWNNYPKKDCIQMAYLGGFLCLFWLTFKPHTEFWILQPIPAFSACSRFGHLIIKLLFKGFLCSGWAHIWTTCTILVYIASSSILRLFWALLVLKLLFKEFLCSVWAHIWTTCTILDFIANSSIFSLFWAP